MFHKVCLDYDEISDNAVHVFTRGRFSLKPKDIVPSNPNHSCYLLWGGCISVLLAINLLKFILVFISMLVAHCVYIAVWSWPTCPIYLNSFSLLFSSHSSASISWSFFHWRKNCLPVFCYLVFLFLLITCISLVRENVWFISPDIL